MPRRSSSSLTPAVLIGLLGLFGCGKDETSRPLYSGGTPASSLTQLTGAFLNGSESGLLTVGIASANLAPSLRAGALTESVVTATGTLSPSVGAVHVTGSYNTVSDSLHLSGSGYSLPGYYWETAHPPVIGGRYEGPNGPGAFHCFPGTPSTVRVFCGQFQSNTTSTSGEWNIVITGMTLAGMEAPSGDTDVVGFSGSVTGTGSTRTLTFSTAGLSGTGSWDTATNLVSGTWTTASDAGTWSGDLCLPAGTGPD